MKITRCIYNYEGIDIDFVLLLYFSKYINRAAIQPNPETNEHKLSQIFIVFNKLIYNGVDNFSVSHICGKMIENDDCKSEFGASAVHCVCIRGVIWMWMSV